MSRTRHIVKKVVEGLLIVFVLLHLSLYVVFQVPAVQTWTARKVADVVEGKINGDISIGRISIVFFNRLSLYDITVKGFGAPPPWGNSDTCRFYNPGDTLAHLSKLSVSFSALELLTGKLGGHRVVLEEGSFHLLREDTLMGTNLSRIFKIPPKDKNKKKKVFPDISVGDVRIRNCRLSIANPFDTKRPDTSAVQMQYNNLKISEMTGHFSDFKTVDGEIRCHIDELSAVEASGTRLKNLTGDFHLGPRGSGMDDMCLEEGEGSTIAAEHLYFIYSSPKEIADWVNSVVMDVKFRKSTFTFNTLKHFVPTMKDNNLTVTIEEGSEVKGTVAEMDARGLSVTLPGGQTKVTVDAVMKGIPDMPNTTITGTADVRISTRDIPPLLSDWTGKRVGGGISNIAKGKIITEKVKIDGPFRKMTLKGEMGVGEGKLSHWLTMNLFTPQFSIGGDVEVKSMDLGAVLGNEMFGIADFSLKGKVASGKKGGINLDYLNVNRFGFIDYDYRNMTAMAELSDTLCHLIFVSRDDEFKVDINFDAFFKGKGRSGRYYCALNAPKADLKQLNLMEKDSVARLNDIHLRLDAEFDGLNNAVGKLDLRDLSYTNSRGTVKMDSLQIISSERDSVFDVSIRSPFFSVDYYGGNPLLVAVLRAKELLFDRQFGKLFAKNEKKEKKTSRKGEKQEVVFLKRNARLTFKTFDTWNLTNVLMDGLYLSDNSTLSMSISETDSVDIQFRSNRLAKKRNYLRDILLRVDNPDSIVRLSLTSPEMRVGNMFLTENKLGMKSNHGVIGLEYLFKDEVGAPDKEMNFFSDVSFSRDEGNFLRTTVRLNGMNLYLGGKKWQMDSSRIVMGHKYLELDRFRFYGEKSELKGNGTISSNPSDEMQVTLNGFDLSVTNDFTNMKLGGVLSGAISIRDYFDQAHFLVDITGSDITLFDNPLGDIKAMSKWDVANERMNILIKSRYQDHSPINLSGYYKHKGKELFVNASLDELSLAYAEPFLKDILKIDGGTLSGHLSLMGKNGQYFLDSDDARFVNFAFAPVYTKVPYLMNGGMKFRRDKITLDSIVIQDRFGNEASLEGHITHNLFSKMNLDVRLAFNEMECLDIKENEGDSFYGKASASGVVSVTGPVSDVLLRADVRTGPGTAIYVPVSNAYAAKSNEILKFKDYAMVFEDPYDSIMVYDEDKEVVEKGKFRLEADATIYEDALVTIELDKDLGNLVECHGNAKARLEIDPSRSITDVKGRYTVTGGKVKYVFAGIMAREFSLNEGGTLDFRGPLSNMQLDIGATYRTRTSVSALIADTSAVGSRQTVYATIGLKGQLPDPGFTFNIEIPDLDPLTRSRVETAFSTDAKIQQQFMALMITGSFIRDEQSGVSNNSNILYSNVSEMFSNQLNNVLRSLDVPIDVGLNYQKTQNQKDVFDVNVSYQAFNNRLVLNGSVGNGNRYQNWGGNFEAELKMDRRGKFRFSLFTRAADQYTNYLDNSQRNGFGFSFQDEFTKFREIFFSRKRRESYELEQVEEARAKLLEEYGDPMEQKVVKEQDVEVEKDTVEVQK